MSIKYSQSLKIWGYEYHNQAPSQLTWPAPLPSATLLPDALTQHMCLSWSGTTDYIEVQSGTVIATRRSDGQVFRLDLGPGRFPPAVSGRLALGQGGCHGYQQDYEVAVNIKLAAPPEPHVVHEGAGSFVGSLVMKQSQDVCLYFPRSDRRLWVDEASLAKISPYFHTLFSSDFLENDPTSSSITEKGDKEEEDTMVRSQYEYDDSDEETDDLTKVSDQGGTKTSETPYKTIGITQHCYETYLALLCWIGTRRIAFAPLRSTFPDKPVEGGKGSGARANVIGDTWDLTIPRSPTLVSPKSIYRLAHYLQITNLSEIALANFDSQLTRENVMEELYSDIASKYSEIRDVALRYAVQHWKGVVTTRGYKEVSKRGDEGGLDGATGFLLSVKLMEKWAK